MRVSSKFIERVELEKTESIYNKKKKYMYTVTKKTKYLYKKMKTFEQFHMKNKLNRKPPRNNLL
jgi:hypothetical protein